MEIILATHNNHKKEEFNKLLSSKFVLLSLSDIGFHEEILENGTTFQENALIKAKAAYEFSGKASFSDDSGLVVPALNGAPGIYSARYSNSGKSEENINLLLKNLEGIEDRKAYFICVICWYDGEKPQFFEGRCYGTIAHNISGANGFGYDPIFIPDSYTESFAEMPAETKNKISHRAKAWDLFKGFVEKEVD